MAHEDLKKQYEEDALWHPKPWRLWEFLSPYGHGWSPCVNELLWLDDTRYRRKPDAPSINCVMCKHSTTNFYFSCHLALGRGPFNLPKHMTSPDWCPLAQKEEAYDMLTAARDLLEWLEGFDLMRGADKVKALRYAVEEAEK